MELIKNPSDPQPVNADNNDSIHINNAGNTIMRIKARNPIYAMAYGGGRTRNSIHIETRIQRIEKQQKIVRRGIVVPALPKFKTQTMISQTSANNPFSSHPNNTITFPSGRVPDTVAPFTNNSQIRYPKTFNLL